MDVLAVTCLAVIAGCAIVITWLLLTIAHEAKRSRRLLEDVTRHLGAEPGTTVQRSQDVDSRPWVAADA